MIEREEIDKLIVKLLNHLDSIQNEDGSFDTMYLQPYYNPDKGWMKYADNSPYETAYPLTVLTQLQSAQSQQITKRGIDYICSKSLDNFLWTYAYPSKDALVPYDTDSTSLCSYVLEKNGYAIKNKDFLNEFIDSNDYYLFYIWETKLDSKIPFLTHLKLKWRNWYTRNSLNILNDGMRLSDSEFTSTCINLLYLSKSKKNERVWQKVQTVFANKSFDFLYYLDLFHALYAYSRLVGYGEHKDLMNDHVLISDYVEQLHNSLNENFNATHCVLLLNTLLLFDINTSKYDRLIEIGLNNIVENKYKDSTAFYSSNVNTDFQPGTTLPNTYFGSPAITCSLYIEFLNLLRKQTIGSFYGAK